LINIPKLNQQEIELLNNLLQKYSSHDLMEFSKKLLDMELKERQRKEYLQAIIQRFKGQAAKGFAKYGQPLELNRTDINDRLEHLSQELTDGLMYIEWIRDGLPNTWRFPEVKFANTNNSYEQAEHVIAEALEVLAEICEGKIDWHKVDMEMADLLHSCETYFRIREREGTDNTKTFDAVIAKNRARGYYDAQETRESS
jgi:NTP pyrophosphatase (non-canonical NTP hydrolase)